MEYFTGGDDVYQTTGIVLKSDSELALYCKEMCSAAKLFKNTVIFRCRQLLSANYKNYSDLQVHEQEVLNEFKLTEERFKPIGSKYYLPGYLHFDYLFKVTENPDYYNKLPMQSNQQIIKGVLADFKGYFKAVKSYKKNPKAFTGKPKLPTYCKADKISFDITNQDCVVKTGKDGISYLKLPKTKLTVNLGKLVINKLKEVTIKPFYNTYKICIISEEPDIEPVELDYENYLSVDLGIDNFITSSNNCGLTPFIVKGNIIKSYNQWFNKKVSYLQSLLPYGQHSSHQIQQLWKKRYHKIADFYNKTAHYVIKYCMDHEIGNLVIGKNTYWKQNINLGKQNNQNFCYISHASFIKKVCEMASKFGIRVILNEESYTSKASFLDNDKFPVYGEVNHPDFSGRRIHRGLYQSKKGILINADVNGASNILKKAVPTAFDKTLNYTYLYQTVNTIHVNP
jgi:putative transposase